MPLRGPKYPPGRRHRNVKRFWFNKNLTFIGWPRLYDAFPIIIIIIVIIIIVIIIIIINIIILIIIITILIIIILIIIIIRIIIITLAIILILIYGDNRSPNRLLVASLSPKSNDKLELS